MKVAVQALLALYADIVRHPAFTAQGRPSLRGRWLAGIAQEKTEPQSLALRVLPPLVYGARHAYAIPLTGSGTEDSIKALTTADLAAFHAVIRPDNARIPGRRRHHAGEVHSELDAVPSATGSRPPRRAPKERGGRGARAKDASVPDGQARRGTVE